MKFTNFSSIGVLGFLLVMQVMLMAPAEGKFISGHLTTGSNFHFMDRFCFQPNEEGTLHYELKYKVEDFRYKLLMFNDDPDQWPYIRENGHEMTCGQKKERIPGTLNAKLTLTESFNGCKIVKDSDGVEWMHCIGGRSFTTDHARWWYLVFANCYSDEKIDIEYNITMTNGDKLWDRHFSADERYMLETDMIFLFVYFAMLAITVYFTKILSERRLLHTTYKLFVWSVLAEFTSLLILTIALGKYGSTGVPDSGLEMFGHFVGVSGNLVFILMIILLGKGFTVTRGTMNETSWMKVAVFMTLYTVTYCILYIYEETMFDPRDVLYKYESLAGYGLVWLALIGFFWTCFAVYQSVREYPQKAAFYVPFGFIFTLWWLATPLTILICNYAVETWVRAKVVNAIERAVICGGHIFFLLLTRPSAANLNFPFHIRTSQIAAMECDDKNAYSGTPALVMRGESGQVIGLNYTDLFLTETTPANKDTVIQIEPSDTWCG